MPSETCKIIRRSIFSFLKSYHYLTSTPSLLLLPFAVSNLVSSSLIASSYLFPLVHARLNHLLLVAGILPPSSHLINFITLNFSQTILTFLFLTPFSYSSLLLAKAAIIRALHHKNPPNLHLIQLFTPLLITQLCNSLLILSANATCFFFLALCFNFFDVLALSSPLSLPLLSVLGGVVFSIINANAYIICNMALVLSAIEMQGGFIMILKACVLMQGRTATALSLAIPINLALAAIEALFQHRVARAYDRDESPNHSTILLEGMLIAYLYAAILILDTVIGCVFRRSCVKSKALYLLP